MLNLLKVALTTRAAFPDSEPKKIPPPELSLVTLLEMVEFSKRILSTL